MNRFFFLMLTTLVLLGCNRADFRNGYSPGEVEGIENGKVFHLADGVFIEERKNGKNIYYLIESTVADYDLTAEGLDVELDGEVTGTFSTAPAPQGYVAAWITEVPGENVGVTRFQIDEARLPELLQNLTATSAIEDIVKLRQ